MVTLVLGTTRCVTESGDIGYFYGVWSLSSMDIDSRAADIVCSDYFWKFQGNVIFISVIDQYHQQNSSVGTWKEEDNRLTLNFTYKNNIEGSENLQAFNPPPELRIPPRQETTMKIVKITDKHLILEYNTPEGENIIYTLKKLK